MQVDPRPAQGDLRTGQPAHRDDGAGEVGRGHAGVADDDDVAVQPGPPLLQQCGEVRRPGLLLALDEQFHGHGRGVPTGRGEVGAHAEQVHGDVALVVDRAAGVQLRAVRSVDDRRLERRVHPQLQRVHRLHVVVPVHERDRGPGVARRPLGVDRGRAGRRPDLDRREADPRAAPRPATRRCGRRRRRARDRPRSTGSAARRRDRRAGRRGARSRTRARGWSRPPTVARCRPPHAAAAVGPSSSLPADG